jgi:hypothetical protein
MEERKWEEGGDIQLQREDGMEGRVSGGEIEKRERKMVWRLSKMCRTQHHEKKEE